MPRREGKPARRESAGASRTPSRRGSEPRPGAGRSRSASFPAPENGEAYRISSPWGFVRGVHVEYDPAIGRFRGIPRVWRDSGVFPPGMVSDQPPEQLGPRPGPRLSRPPANTGSPILSAAEETWRPEAGPDGAGARGVAPPAPPSPQPAESEYSTVSNAVSLQPYERQLEFHTGVISSRFYTTQSAREVPLFASVPTYAPDALPPELEVGLPPREILKALQERRDVYISKPLAFKHDTHVQVDPTSSTGFSGLPREWVEKLEKAGVDLREANIDDITAIMDNIYAHGQEKRAPGASGAEDPMLCAVGEYHRPEKGPGRRSGPARKRSAGAAPEDSSAGPTVSIVAPLGPPKPRIPKFSSLPTAEEVNSLFDRIGRLFTEVDHPAELFADRVLIGRGSSGHVYRAVEKSSNRVVAIKVVSTEHFLIDDRVKAATKPAGGADAAGAASSTASAGSKSSCASSDSTSSSLHQATESQSRGTGQDDSFASLKNEVALMFLSKHRNVVELYSVFLSFKTKEIYIVMEYMNAGCLTNILTRHRYIRKERIIQQIVRDTLQALAFLHREHRIYRDLKSDNLLIKVERAKAPAGGGGARPDKGDKGDKPDRAAIQNGFVVDPAPRTQKHYCLKLSDFGFACQLTSEQATRKSVVGTPFWMAPELIRGWNYTSKVDIWSLGVLCLELAQSYPPYIELPPLKAIIQIVTQPPPTLRHPERWSADFADFLTHCFEKDPEQRWSCDQLLQHPWITAVGDSPLDLEEYL